MSGMRSLIERSLRSYVRCYLCAAYHSFTLFYTPEVPVAVFLLSLVFHPVSLYGLDIASNGGNTAIDVKLFPKSPGLSPADRFTACNSEFTVDNSDNISVKILRKTLKFFFLNDFRRV